MSASKEPAFTQSLLARAHSPTTAARIFSEKIKSKPLILTPSTSKPQPRDARAARTERRDAAAAQRRRKMKSKNKPAPLSAKQKRALCVHELPREEVKFDIYAGLHRLWCGYIRETLGLPRDGFSVASEAKAVRLRPDHVGPLVAAADFHGAYVSVVRARCVSRVGVEGVVVRDTKSTFVLVGRGDKARTVPKEGCTFAVEIPLMQDQDLLKPDGTREAEVKPLAFALHGDAFQTRPSERAGKKFKFHAAKGL